MTDLVQRLRDHRTSAFDIIEAAWKAADRIEALERENADLKAEINRLLGIHKTLETAWEAFSKFEDKKQPGRVIKFDNRFKK